jgi:pimeloyl-ACP methyl ester carboxylesterase
LSQISIPALIVWGEKDKITSLSDAYLMKKEIPNSTLEIIPKVGHRVNLDAPEKLADIIIKFLNQQK